MTTTTAHEPRVAPPQLAATSDSSTGPSGWSIASLVVGIVSVLAGWTFLAPIAGLALGIIGLRQDGTQRGIGIAGVVVNAAILTLGVLAVVVTGFSMAVLLPFVAMFG